MIGIKKLIKQKMNWFKLLLIKYTKYSTRIPNKPLLVYFI